MIFPKASGNMTAHPTARPSNAAITVTLVAALLLPDFIREAPTTPPHIAKGFAVATTAIMVIWWAWWLSKRGRLAEPATGAIGAPTLAATTAGLAASLAQWHWFEGAHGPAQTWSAALLLVAFGPLAMEALLRVYLQPRLEGTMSTRDLVFTCTAAGAVLGGSSHHAFANAMIAAVLTLLVLRTGKVVLAPVVHCAIALITELAMRTTPVPVNRPVVAVALAILALGAAGAVVKSTKGSLDSDATAA